MTTNEKFQTTAIQAVRGSKSLAEAILALRPAKGSTVDTRKPKTPVALSEQQKSAVKQFTKVFGSVVPTEPRALTAAEIAALYEERQTIDAVEKAATARKTAIRDTIADHITELLLASGDTEIEYDEDGHALVATRVGVEGADQVFSWEIRSTNSLPTAENLKDLVDQGQLDHEDYLKMTKQTRVLDEHATLQLLATKPEILELLAAATPPAKKTGSLYVRKA